MNENDVRPLLSVEGLWKSYDAAKREKHARPALRDVSFSIRSGETLGIVGESGSGKSTIARCVAGLAPATKGAIEFQGRVIPGQTVNEQRYIRRNIQMVFQDPFASLNPRKQIGASIAEPLRSYGMGRREREERVHELLALVGLRAGDADRYPRSFSGGQRQRIGIARAIALNPQLLIADEPTSALDVSIQAQILNLLVDLQHERGLAMLFISHDLHIVRHTAERVIVMFQGSVVEGGKTEEVFAHPAHPYTRDLLAAAPRLETKLELSSRTALDELAPSTGCPYVSRCSVRREECSNAPPKLVALGDDRQAACYAPLAVTRVSVE